MHIVAIVHGGNGAFSVSFPDLPGCVAAGETEQKALEDAAEAMAFHLEGMREDGEPIPTPRSIDALRADPEFAVDFAGHAAIALLPFDGAAAVAAAE